MVDVELVDLLHWIWNNLNALGTGLALILSFASLGIQYKRHKREVGDLEVVEVYESEYWRGKGEYEGKYGGTNVQQSRLSTNIIGRNVRDGVLQVYGIEIHLDGIDDEVELNPNNGLPLKLSSRDEFDKYFDGDLDHNVDLSGEIRGQITFDTSNGKVTHSATFTARE